MPAPVRERLGLSALGALCGAFFFLALLSSCSAHQPDLAALRAQVEQAATALPAELAPPRNLQATDAPDDAGGRVLVSWDKSESDAELHIPFARYIAPVRAEVEARKLASGAAGSGAAWPEGEQYLEWVQERLAAWPTVEYVVLASLPGEETAAPLEVARIAPDAGLKAELPQVFGHGPETQSGHFHVVDVPAAAKGAWATAHAYLSVIPEPTADLEALRADVEQYSREPERDPARVEAALTAIRTESDRAWQALEAAYAATVAVVRNQGSSATPAELLAADTAGLTADYKALLERFPWAAQHKQAQLRLLDLDELGQERERLLGSLELSYVVALEANRGAEDPETPSVGVRVPAAAPVSASATPNLFNRSKLNNFVLMLVFSAAVLIFIQVARRNPKLYLRRIGGLEAVDEAIGRATEMGKPVLFVHGLTTMGEMATIASINILGPLARRVASFESTLLVTNSDPVVLAVSQETVKEAYLNVGRPDQYNEDHVFFVAADQFSYTAAVNGIMVRERPAANFYMGGFYAESLLLSETGALTGSIQIAGTDSYTQLPFFITTCDFTLLGEELYAASAYLSREPMLLGSLRGQDVAKAFMILVLILGTLLATFGVQTLSHILQAY